jgi:hypothetical protein
MVVRRQVVVGKVVQAIASDHPAYRVELAVDHLVAPGLVELVKSAGELADAGQVEVIDCGSGHFHPLSPRRLGPSILSDSLSNVHEMFVACHGVLSGPEMGHTAEMARATHLHGRRNGWSTGAAVLLGVLAAGTRRSSA